MSSAEMMAGGFVAGALLMLLVGILGSAISDDLTVSGARRALDQHPEETSGIVRELFSGLAKSEFVAIMCMIGAIVLLFASPGRSMLVQFLGMWSSTG